MRRTILVNGVPASGKSSLARSIADALELPILTLDTIKEPFFDHLGIGDREYNRKLGRASYQAIWNTIRDTPPSVTFVVDAWFGFQPREVLETYLEAAGSQPLEIWCFAPPEVIAERFRARVGQRSAGHLGESYVPELTALAARAEPMRIGPTFSVDTAKQLDREAVLQWTREHLR